MSPQYTTPENIQVEPQINSIEMSSKSVDEILNEFTLIERSTYLQDKKNGEYAHSLNGLYLLVRVCIDKKHQFFWLYTKANAERFIDEMHANRYECHEVFWHANCRFFCDIDLIMPVDMRSKLLDQVPEDELFGSVVDAYEQAINLSLKSHGIVEDIDFAIIKRCRETEAGYKYSIHLVSQFWMSIAKAKELAKDAMTQIDMIDTELDRELLKRSFDLQPYHKHGSLSMVGGWKGDHCNRLHASCLFGLGNLITVCHDNCEVLPTHAFPTTERIPGAIDSDFIKEALMHVQEIPDWSDAFDLDASSLKGNTMIVRRVRASECSICDRMHDSDNTMLLSFSGDVGKAFWKCMHSIGQKAKMFYKRSNKDPSEDPIDWPEISSLIDNSSEIPAIFDKQNRSCFEDCTELSKQKVADMPQLIKYLIDNVAYITAGGNGFFQTKQLDEFGNLTYSQVSTNSLKSLLVQFAIMGNDGKIRKRSMFSIACKYISDLSYGRVDFIPYGSKSDYDWTDRNAFNTFTGFMHVRQPDFQIDHSLINGYLDHIKNVWCAGNQALYDSTIKQFSHFVQKPNIKTQTCLVAMGREGCGKNRPIDLLSKHVLGSQYVAEVSKMDKVVGRFNAMLENKLLCVLNEASDCSSQESLANQDKLKDLITNESIVIERKGVDPYTIADRCNYICFSNNHYVIKASTEMRRFVFYEVSDCHMGDHEYFQRLTDDFEKRGAGIHLYHYLMSIDISDFVPQRDFPQTTFKAQMQSDAISRDGQWLIAYCNEELQSNYSPVEGFNSSVLMLEKLNGWLISQGYNSTWNQDKLGRFLKKLGIESDRPRINGIKVRGFIINRDDLKDKLSTYLRRTDLFAKEDDPLDVVPAASPAAP